MRRTSIRARAAWAAFASASTIGAFAAIAAITFSDLLVVRQTDEYLTMAATELARDVRASDDIAVIEAAVEDEQGEATSKGIRFAVWVDGLLVGDPAVLTVTDGCITQEEARICGVSSGRKRVMAATSRKSDVPLRILAGLAAALLSGLLAWAIAQILARRAMAPLVRLQTRIASIPLSDKGSVGTQVVTLGEDEGVVEVDEVRRALGALLERMHDALALSATFAASAAHELRTPLTALRAELELLAETVADERSAAALAVALRKVQHLHSVTERLLLLATPDDDAGELELVSLRDVVDEALGSLAPGERARVTLDDDSDAFVRGDAAALGMAVSNGLSNALKFGERVRIEIESREGEVTLAIDDDGPGVPIDERQRVFEPFARGTTTRRIPGHGLGLALVARVASRHRGHAQLTSTRHGAQGARLEIELPRGDARV